MTIVLSASVALVVSRVTIGERVMMALTGVLRASMPPATTWDEKMQRIVVQFPWNRQTIRARLYKCPSAGSLFPKTPGYMHAHGAFQGDLP